MGLQVHLTVVEYEDDENGDTISVESDVFGKEISHELRFMAEDVSVFDVISVFDVVWRPSESGFTSASKIFPYLESGMHMVEIEREYLENPARKESNRYEEFLSFLKEYKSACEKYPDAKISVVW